MDEYELELDINNTCRVCLQSPDRLINIFSNVITDGKIVAFPKMLISCLNLEVKESEKELPSKVCDTCKIQIVNFYSLKEKCKKSEILLKQVFLKNNVIVVDSNESKKVEEVEKVVPVPIKVTVNEQVEDDAKLLESILSEDEHICGICDEIFDTFELLKKHSDAHHLINKTATKDIEISKKEPEVDKTIKIQNLVSSQIKLEIVNELIIADEDEEEEIFNEKLGFIDPLIDQLPDENTEEQDDAEMIEDDAFTHEIGFVYECDKCNEQFQCNETYVNHCMTHDFFCVKCGQFLNEEDAQKHFENHELMDSASTHVKSNLFCVYCNKKVRSKAQFDHHVKMHETINIVVEYIEYHRCDECRTMFLYEEELVEHKKKHSKTKSPSKDLFVDDKSCTDYQFLDDDKEPTEDAIYSCGVCEKFEATIPDLKQHIVLHSKKFSCPFSGCGSQYDMIARLHLHIQKKHFQGNIYNCDHCKEVSLTSFDDLQNHMKNDCKERKFLCNHCDKSFFSRKALLMHIKHSKEKKYVCGYCGKQFSQQGELNIHHRSHTNEKPFVCTICEKAYKTSSMRTAHMDTHIIGKTFECNICDKKLQTRVSYRNHMNRHSFGKRHMCEVCGKKFHTKYHVKLHASKIHPNYVPTKKELGELLEEDMNTENDLLEELEMSK